MTIHAPDAAYVTFESALNQLVDRSCPCSHRYRTREPYCSPVLPRCGRPQMHCPATACAPRATVPVAVADRTTDQLGERVRCEPTRLAGERIGRPSRNVRSVHVMQYGITVSGRPTASFKSARVAAPRRAERLPHGPSAGSNPEVGVCARAFRPGASIAVTRRKVAAAKPS